MYADIRTSLSPERANEAPFMPTAMMEETIMMQPLDEVQIPSVPEDSNKQVYQDDDDDELDDVKKKSKRGLKIFFVLLGLAILVGGGLFFIGQKQNKNSDVVIPDITGKTEAQARKILKESNITVKDTEEITDEKIEKGKVVKTKPPIGTSVKKNSGDITIYISSGQSGIKMPDYTGQDGVDVREDLISKGFKEE
ncbi:MAG: PASTA domain-containing protein, partial [Vagococcus sp.]